MELTKLEQNVLAVALDHMHDHLCDVLLDMGDGEEFPLEMKAYENRLLSVEVLKLKLLRK